MYLKDKTNNITLSLTDNQFKFVQSRADVLGVSPADFIWMLVNASMVRSASCINPAYADLLDGCGHKP